MPTMAHLCAKHSSHAGHTPVTKTRIPALGGLASRG